MQDPEEVDDPDKDEDFDPSTEQPEKEKQGEATGPLTIEESIATGIPMDRQKRSKKKDPNVFKIVCDLCQDRFQRSNDLADHKYVVHLGKTYDCETCIKHFRSQKALRTHFKLQHDGVGRVKCTEEGCDWKHNDPGQLHNHLLEKHGIGEPIKCQMKNSDGVTCGKIFKNTRSFQEHKSVHMVRNVECTLCNRLFPTEEHRKVHVKRYHITATQKAQFQCDECGKTFDSNQQLASHKQLHMLKRHRELQEKKS